MPQRAKRVQTVETVKRFKTGAKSSIGTSRVQISETSFINKKGFLIIADKDNAGTVYIGDSTVTAGTPDNTSGFPLRAEQWLEIEVEDVSDVYAIASEATQKVYFATL